MSDKQSFAGVKIWIDKNFLQTTKGAGEMLTCLETSNVNCIIEKLPVVNSLFWTRVDGKEETQHDHILVRIDWEFFLDAATDFVASPDANSLLKFLDTIKSSSQCTQVTLLVFEFKKNLKNFKGPGGSVEAGSQKSSAKQKKTKLTKSDLNDVLIALELEQNVQFRSYEGVAELKDLVLCYTKAVCEYSSRFDNHENMMFSDKSIEKSQTKIGKDGQNLINLWKDLIQTFPMVTSDQAQAICSAYPSPLLLKKAYEQNGSSASMLLADIQVRRGAGVLSSVRRIGPELSQKLHKFFTTLKPDELLVND